MPSPTETPLPLDAAEALAGFVRTLVRFWSSDPDIIRRLHAMAALDGEIARGLDARRARRRRAADDIVRPTVGSGPRANDVRAPGLLADVLCTLASFETYDALASAGHGREEIIASITRLARCALASE